MPRSTWSQLLALGLFGAFMALTSCSDDPSSNQKSSSATGPRIQVEKTSHDFGNVFAGAEKEAEFEIINSGAERLMITRAEKECGCTQPTFSSQIVEPGAKAVMKVKLIAPIFHGTLKKRIRVFTNDPVQEETVFHLKCECMGQASISPITVQFESPTVMTAKEHRETFKIELPPGQPMLSVQTSQESPFIRAEIKKGRGTNTGEIDLIFTGLRESVRFKDYLQLEIRTKDKGGKERILSPQGIQVTGSLKPRFTAIPAMHSIGVEKPGSKVLLRGHIEDLGDQAIESIAVVGPGTWKTQSSQEANEFLGELLLPPREGRFFTQLRITLSGGESLVVPVLGWLEMKS